MPTTGTTAVAAAGLDTAHLVHGGSPLDVVETAFRLLTTDAEPLSMDGAALGHGLPRRRIVLRELAAILMHPSYGFPASDAAWRLLVDRARTTGQALGDRRGRGGAAWGAFGGVAARQRPCRSWPRVRG